MKTFRDFTWEWIIQTCQTLCDQLLGEGDFEDLPDRIKGYVESAQGLIAIVPSLREHPQLGELVPMMSLFALRWFPADGYEVNLFREGDGSYSVTMLKVVFDRDEILETKVVAHDEVADEVYAYIARYDDE